MATSRHATKSSRGGLERPNVLLIMTDYQRAVDGPSLGSPFLDMPALDRLCREGVVCDRYFCTSPICMPARYTLISGQYPHQHGQQENWPRWMPEDTPTLMEVLRRCGYHTIGVGKMHFYPWNRMAGFERRVIADCKHHLNKPDDFQRMLQENGLERSDYLRLADEADIPHVYDWPYDERLHIDAFVGAQARGIIERDELEWPWFMWVSFNGPHNPWDPPRRYTEPYLQMDLPKPVGCPGELEAKPKEHRRVRYNYTPEVVERIDRDPEHRDEIIRQIRAHYYGNLTLIDRQVEGVLDALEAKGELDNTLVIYTSDHGCALGDHDLIHKGLHYDCDARVPFVVRYPGWFEPRRVGGFASHVDFLPTLLSMLDLPVPAGVEGVDFSALLSGEVESVQDFVVLECRFNTSIISDRWKMGVYHLDDDGDLYDLRADPHELNNLYGTPEVADVQAELTRRLLDWRQQLGPEMKRMEMDGARRAEFEQRWGI